MERCAHTYSAPSAYEFVGLSDVVALATIAVVVQASWQNCVGILLVFRCRFLESQVLRVSEVLGCGICFECPAPCIWVLQCPSVLVGVSDVGSGRSALEVRVADACCCGVSLCARQAAFPVCPAASVPCVVLGLLVSGGADGSEVTDGYSVTIWYSCYWRPMIGGNTGQSGGAGHHPIPFERRRTFLGDGVLNYLKIRPWRNSARSRGGDSNQHFVNIDDIPVE